MEIPHSLFTLKLTQKEDGKLTQKPYFLQFWLHGSLPEIYYFLNFIFPVCLKLSSFDSFLILYGSAFRTFGNDPHRLPELLAWLPISSSWIFTFFFIKKMYENMFFILVLKFFWHVPLFFFLSCFSGEIFEIKEQRLATAWLE